MLDVSTQNLLFKNKHQYNIINRHAVTSSAQIRQKVNSQHSTKNLDKKAQLSLTNPRDACVKFARFT